MLNAIFSTIQQAYLQLIAPPFCIYCRSFLVSDTIFCVHCSEKIKPIVSAQMPVSKLMTVPVYAMSAYKDPIKRLILAKCWCNILASRHIGQLMWQYTYIPYVDFDYVVPIPLHWTRYISRGYNQAFEMASVLSTKSNKPVVSFLKRTHRTHYQATLSVGQRKKNVQKVFSVTQKGLELIEGRHILLVDDLMTTGATLQEAAKAILKYKPEKISAIVAARVI